MTTEELQRRFSLNLKRLRKIKNFTQETLAEKAELSAQMINDIEGCRRWPSEKTLTKIANALSIDVYEFFLPVEEINEISPAVKRTVALQMEELFHKCVKEYIQT